MDTITLILASTSPRRRELLSAAGIQFIISPPDFDESQVKTTNPIQLIRELSLGKAKNVAYNKEIPSVIMGVDTVVYFKNEILGKANNKNEALQFMQKLSGNWHKVYSGISLYNTATQKVHFDYSCTKVKLAKLDNDFLKYYIERDLFKGYAGGYAIQNIFSLVVEKIIGSYSGVVGLPMETLYSLFKQNNYSFFE